MSTYNSAAIEEFNGGVWVFCEQRQGKMMPTSFELISEGRKLADELGSKLYGILLGHNVEAVSYTHLDVYKRQQLKSTERFCRMWSLVLSHSRCV